MSGWPDLYARIANIRQDALNPLTTSLTRRCPVIGIEDLNVSGMLKNRRLAPLDCGHGVLRVPPPARLQERPVRQRGGGGGLLVCQSKTCSCCGYVLESLPLLVRGWTCPACQTSHDRDGNAAINLKHDAVSSTVSACGGKGAGPGGNAKAKPPPAKQEVSAKATYG